LVNDAVVGPSRGMALLVGWPAVSLAGEPTPGTAPTPAAEAEQPSGEVQERAVRNAPRGAVALKNYWKPDQYVNIESGPLVAGPIQPGWLSAQWTMEPVARGIINIPGMFDLVPSPPYPPQDDNGLPLNPRWKWQTFYPNVLPPADDETNPYCGSKPWQSPCTSYPTEDDNKGLGKNVLETVSLGLHGQCYSGHHNWMPVTYTGTIYWEAKSPNGTDDDYNFRLVPPAAGKN